MRAGTFVTVSLYLEQHQIQKLWTYHVHGHVEAGLRGEIAQILLRPPVLAAGQYSFSCPGS